MGKVEEKIKQELFQTIFNDSYKIYEFIDNRFILEEEDKSNIIEKINRLNNELIAILNGVKLS